MRSSLGIALRRAMTRRLVSSFISMPASIECSQTLLHSPKKKTHMWARSRKKNQGILKRPAIMQGSISSQRKGSCGRFRPYQYGRLVNRAAAFGARAALITKEVYSSLTIGVLMGMVDLPVHSRGVGVDQFIAAFTMVPRMMATQIADNGALLLFPCLIGRAHGGHRDCRWLARLRRMGVEAREERAPRLDSHGGSRHPHLRG